MSADPAVVRGEMRDTVERSGLLRDARDEWITDQAAAKAAREIEQEHRDREEAA